MQFYEVHRERLSLREIISLNSSKTVLRFIVWFLIKIRIMQVETIISSLRGEIRKQLIQLDQIPKHAQPELVSIMNQLEEYGFVDSLIENQLHGIRFDNLKMTGARVLARHKSGRFVASVMMDYDEESSHQRVESIYTFIDSVETISTTNGRRYFNETPGNSVSYYPDISFEELVAIHRQAIAKRGDSYKSIHNQDEMLTYAQGLVDRFVDHWAQRGYLVKTEPDLPSFIEYENEKGTDEKSPNPLIQFLIGLSAFLIVFTYILWKRLFWGP